MKNNQLHEPMIPGIAEKMGYQSIKLAFNPLSGYCSVIYQLNQRLRLQIDPLQIDQIARKLRLITSEHIQKNMFFYKEKLLLMKEIVPLEGKEDPAGIFNKYLESFPTPHTTPFELQALAYTLNIRMVILINEDKWFIFNKSADAVTHVVIVCDDDQNFYFLKDLQNPTAQVTREKYNEYFHLECKEKTPSFQEGTFNLPIKETLTLGESVVMTDFTLEHNSLAKEQGYTIAPVPRDGLSAYYAVIDQLNRILNFSITGLTLAYVQYVHNHQLNKIAEHLRKLVSDHIIKNSHHYILDISKHFSVDPHLKNLLLPMAFLFTKELAEQKTSAPHHELELNVLANVLNIRMIILKEKTYYILNNRSDTITTAWISQNQEGYGSLQPINDESAQFSRQRWLLEIDKKPHHSEKNFAPGTFSLPIREILTFEEKNKNSPVDSTLNLFPDIQKDFQTFKVDITRLFEDSPFRNSLVFKDIIEAQSKSQLVKIIEKFMAWGKLLFPEKTALTLKLEMLLESYRPEEKGDPILMRENLPTTAFPLSTVAYSSVPNYSFFPLPMTFPTPTLASIVSPASNNPSPPVSKRKPQQQKASHLRGKTGEHKCDFKGCDKRFEHNFTLKRHKKIHTNKEKFCCNVPGCEKKYTQKANLTSHQRKVHEHKRFCCNVPGCTKKFTENAVLKKHKLRVHNLPLVSIPDLTVAPPTSAEIAMTLAPAIIPVITQTESPRLIERAPATPLLAHPHESQISSITEMIKNMLALTLSNPPLTFEQRESQISSLTETVRNMLVLLPSSPKQRELVSTVTESLRQMLASILSTPLSDPAQRKSQIFSVTEMVRDMIYLKPSPPDSNLESKRSASLSDGDSSIGTPPSGR